MRPTLLLRAASAALKRNGLAKPNVAVLGATGAVGVEFLQCMEKRNFPVNQLRLLASARSKGSSLTFNGASYPVEEVGPHSFEGIDVAFFSAGGARSKQW